MRLASLVVAAAIVAAAPPPARGQIAELAAIRAAASAIAARSRLLETRAGAEYQPRVLEEVRRSCAARGVTRLDEIAPAEVSGEAAGVAATALLAFDFASAAPPAPGAGQQAPLERIDKSSDFEFTARGLVLRSGQVRTTEPFAIVRDEIGTIEIDIATTSAGHLLLGWSDSADAPRLRRNNARIELVADGRMHTYAVDAADTLARGLATGASVRRFFFASRTDAPLEIRAFRVLSRAHRYAGKPFGSSHEARGGELRSVLYMHPPAALAFDVDVPTDRPVLETGLAILSAQGVVEFEIAVTEIKKMGSDPISQRDAAPAEKKGSDPIFPDVLLKRLVRSAPWEDVSLDLGAWAGRRVRVSLAARGTRDAIALWSSPLVRPRLAADRTEPFVVLLEDALRADRLSVYGGPVASPAHERIGAAGIVFERAFAQATQTRSSVPSMMTSLLPSATGTWDFSDALSDRYVTLAEALRACGFATASFLQNGNAGAYAGLAQGFDVVFAEESFGPRAADLLGSAALEKWISRQSGRPWFAYVHVLDPHGPYDPLERPDLTTASLGDELQRDRSIDAPWLDKPTGDSRRLLYDAEVAANDRALSEFLDRLESRGDLERAVVAVVADHGEFLGEHGGLWRHHPPGHVEVARVPFLLRAPGAAAKRVHEPVGLLDLMPTLLDIAGAHSAALTMHGTSLAPVLRGGRAAGGGAVVADEMLLDAGDRRAQGCGSFATLGALWLLSCTRDEDFTPGRLLATRSGGPAPLRLFELSASPQDEGQLLSVESMLGDLSRAFLEGVSRRALLAMQTDNLTVWQQMTDAAAGRIVSEPATVERLRALGYAQ
ncbi:MAG: sulfatase [Candidatus Binatia bacterium]